jgi:hypothetical protein
MYITTSSGSLFSAAADKQNLPPPPPIFTHTCCTSLQFLVIEIKQCPSVTQTFRAEQYTVTFSLEQAMNAQKGSRGIALLFL